MTKFETFIDEMEKSQIKGHMVLGWWSNCLNCQVEPDADFNLIVRSFCDFGLKSISLSMKPNGYCLLQASPPNYFNPHNGQNSLEDAI